MTKWEYLTAPVLVHATKQILDNFGSDGLGARPDRPGHEPGEPRRLLQAPRGGLSDGPPEERLAELGLTVPEVAKPVAAYVPAVRTGNHVFTSGQLPMRDGELMLTGKVGGEVSPEEAVECARQCALNALAAVKAEIGDLVRGEAGRQGGRVRGLDARLHRPAAGGQRRLRAVRRRSSATPACTPGRRSACPCCRWTRRSRSSWSSRSEPCCGSRCRRSWSSRRGRTPTARGSRPSRATRRPWCCCAAAARGLRSTCCAGRRRWPSRRDVRLPRRRRRPARLRRAVAWAGPAARRVGRAARDRRGRGAGAGVCGGAGDVRGVGRAAGRHSPTDVVADTTGDDWEADRVALEARELALTDFLRPPRAGAAHRPARCLGGVADAGLRAAPLPHLVLRRRRCPRASARATCRPSRRRSPGCRRCEAVQAVDDGEMMMLPPTYLTCLEVGAVRRPGRRARRGGRPQRRDVHPRGRPARRTTRPCRCRIGSAPSSSERLGR